MVPAAEVDLQPSATGFVGGGLPLGGYGGFGGLGHGVSGLQSGYGSAGYGQGVGGYSNYGNNKALAGGSFGRGAYGKGAVSAFGNQGLGQGGVDQLVAHGLHGVAGATGYNHQGGVNKNFASKGGAKDQFNAGHNKVFAKEKVYAVDQSFQNGNRDAFNLGFGSLGGFTGQGGFGKHDKVNQFGNQKYGAFKGYGQGNYGKQAHNTYGEGLNGYNNYGHLNGYGTQAYQNKGYGNYGRGGIIASL
ncbi:secreted protein, putative [Ixodes scapularis]|uniref:Secreted protein, putative n=1 Tax=Ixodes scapularis TaxID=6945 RepID=B7QGC1_IXOSC|nr:secreted protein, putative [Ixodes scapularis]|eukprot:XP_002401404.1 secreted protein, putative [Ixodes scapularis]